MARWWKPYTAHGAVVCADDAGSAVALAVHPGKGTGHPLFPKSHDLEPFNQALAGFVGGPSNTYYRIRLAWLQEGGKQHCPAPDCHETAPRCGDRSPGGAGCQGLSLPDLPSIFVMVSNPPKYGLQGANIAGVSLESSC